ncbi:hypothetical protein AUJ68_02070 [Candidatus Woesearchaeota archaeon CG1_02_57_44]|nr:MAG: hypothetical protein AUJ68_02070 [Candidatus Woesearchaeota archaeon CG1_02_57_44]
MKASVQVVPAEQPNALAFRYAAYTLPACTVIKNSVPALTVRFTRFVSVNVTFTQTFCVLCTIASVTAASLTSGTVLSTVKVRVVVALLLLALSMAVTSKDVAPSAAPANVQLAL